jgi:malate permease and related proteins
MSDVFVSSFLTMFSTVVKILMIAFLAGLLVRQKLVAQEHVRGLSEIVVMVLLPAMMFSMTINTFRPNETPGWWILPLIGMAMPLLGLFFSYLIFWKRPAEGKNIFAVASFQNSAYLVLPIGQMLFPDQFSEFALYCFLYVMGFNPVFWSIGKYFSTAGSHKMSLQWKDFITPPLIANLTAVILVLLGLEAYIPKIILEPIQLIGSATVPMATFVLGATLGAISFRIWPRLVDLFKLILIKFILIPVIVVYLLWKLKIDQYSALLATFLVIEASAAPATNIIVMIRKYGGNTQQVGGMMIVCYFFAILAMPVWMAVWELLHK